MCASLFVLRQIHLHKFDEAHIHLMRHTYTHAHTCTCLHDTQTHTYTKATIRDPAEIYICTRKTKTHACICLHVCTYKDACMCVYIHMYTQYVYTHAHTHTHHTLNMIFACVYKSQYSCSHVLAWHARLYTPATWLIRATSYALCLRARRNWLHVFECEFQCNISLLCRHMACYV